MVNTTVSYFVRNEGDDVDPVLLNSPWIARSCPVGCSDLGSGRTMEACEFKKTMLK